jgi:hypothetical protein
MFPSGQGVVKRPVSSLPQRGGEGDHEVVEGKRSASTRGAAGPEEHFSATASGGPPPHHDGEETDVAPGLPVSSLPQAGRGTA